jgi:hypothetical protein
MNKKQRTLLVVSLILICATAGILFVFRDEVFGSRDPLVFYVSPTGTDTNEGTITAPLKTIEEAVNRASNFNTRIIIESGNYPESIDLEKKKNIQFIANGKVTMNGTKSIDGTWISHATNIWKIPVIEDLWQVFVSDELATYSRWPNAQLYEEGNIDAYDSIWNQQATWRKMDASSELGKMVDARPTPLWKISSKEQIGGHFSPELPIGMNNQFLAELPFSVAGAIAILNIGNWLTFVQTVSTHTIGANYFSYNPDFSNNGPGLDWDSKFYNDAGTAWLRGMVASDGTGRYYLEGKLNFLDTEHEWYYDKTNKQLYLYSSTDPNGLAISAKVREFAFYGNKTENLLFDGIDFWASTVEMDDAKNITIQNSNMGYYATSERPLGDVTRPETLAFYNSEKISLINNTMGYTDGIGVIMEHVTSPILLNNYFHDIDFSSQSDGSDSALKTINTEGMYCGYNTVIRAGNSETIRGGKKCTIEYNYVSQGGLMQSDGAAINVSPDEQSGSVVRYNWIINTSKSGIRFDGVGPTPIGTNGKVHSNVVVGAIWSNIHGDSHEIYNNTMYGAQSTDLVIAGQSLVNIGGTNPKSSVHHNLVEAMSEAYTQTTYSIQATLEGNVINTNISDHMVGAKELDYRIRSDSSYYTFGAGAYQNVEKNYFIGGYQSVKTSLPIPYSGYVGDRDDLIFRKAYQAVNYKVYIATSLSSLDSSLHVSQADNIIPIVSLTGGNTLYYWRVDAIQANGAIIKGDVWSFTLQ